MYVFKFVRCIFSVCERGLCVFSLDSVWHCTIKNVKYFHLIELNNPFFHPYLNSSCIVLQLKVFVVLILKMSLPARKPTKWTLRKESTRVSLSILRRLTRRDTLSLLWIFCSRNHYTIPLSTWDGMCLPRLAYADCEGWSGSIHYADAIMLVFSLK